MPRLLDGREVPSNSQEWRAHCEALHIANLPTLARRRSLLHLIREKRGDAEYRRLCNEVRKIWDARDVPESTAA